MKRVGRFRAAAVVACAGFLLSMAGQAVMASPQDLNSTVGATGAARVAAASGWELRKLDYDLAAVRRGAAPVRAVHS